MNKIKKKLKFIKDQKKIISWKNVKRGGNLKFERIRININKKNFFCFLFKKKIFRHNLSWYANPAIQNIREEIIPWVNIIKKAEFFVKLEKKRITANIKFIWVTEE